MKNLMKVLLVGFVAASCSKGAFKKEQGSFKANGVEYKATEDFMYAEADKTNTNFLSVSVKGGSNSTYLVMLTLDVSKVNQSVALDSNSTGFTYNGVNTASFYKPISGEWKITGRDDKNAASKYTEGSFAFVGVNIYNKTDTVRITDGYFYVNNY